MAWRAEERVGKEECCVSSKHEYTIATNFIMCKSLFSMPFAVNSSISLAEHSSAFHHGPKSQRHVCCLWVCLEMLCGFIPGIMTFAVCSRSPRIRLLLLCMTTAGNHCCFSLRTSTAQHSTPRSFSSPPLASVRCPRFPPSIIHNTSSTPQQ